MLHGSPKKLNDGTWGAICTDEGQNLNGPIDIRITTQAGKSWDAWVSGIVYRGKGVIIVRTRGKQTRRNNNNAHTRPSQRVSRRESHQLMIDDLEDQGLYAEAKSYARTHGIAY